MINKISILLLAIFLSGCATNKISPKNIADIEAGTKAAIVINCDSNVKIPSFFGMYKSAKNNIRCNTKWQRGSTNQYIHLDKMSVYVIEPGIYNLRSLDVYIDRNGSKYFAHNLAHLASFTAHGGEVIYLGNLKFDLSQTLNISEGIRLYDDFTAAQIMMEKINPILAGKLDRRLINLSGIHTEAIAEYYDAPAPVVHHVHHHHHHSY